MDDALSIGLSVVFSGLLVGMIYAVVASGLSLIHGTVLMPQASNGQVFLGAGLLYWLFGTYWEWPAWVAVPAIFICIGCGIMLLERLILRRFYQYEDRSITYLIVTLGLAQVLSGIYSGAFGKISDTFAVTPIVTGYAMIDPVPLSNARLLALLLAGVVLGVLFGFLRLHRLGRALRAVFQNREIARLRGIDTHQIYRLALLLGTMVTTAGGLLFATAFTIDLSVGWTVTLITFAIMVVGGPGSILGALCVGLVFGFTQALVSVVADPTVSTFAYLLAMLAMLLLRPAGLFVR